MAVFCKIVIADSVGNEGTSMVGRCITSAWTASLNVFLIAAYQQDTRTL